MEKQNFMKYFRVWDIVEKIYLEDNCFYINSCGEIAEIKEQSVFIVEKDEYVVQKNTGLFDLYENPIFEGDLVKLYYHNSNIFSNEYEIKYSRGRWMLDGEKDLTELWFDNKKCGDCCKVVVVGGIYDKDR